MVNKVYNSVKLHSLLFSMEVFILHFQFTRIKRFKTQDISMYQNIFFKGAVFRHFKKWNMTKQCSFFQSTIADELMSRIHDNDSYEYFMKFNCIAISSTIETGH